MTERCIEIHELESVLELSAGDPRRRHLADCPRCRALLASYREFLDPSEPPAGAADASRRLSAALEAEILAAGPAAGPAGGPPRGLLARFLRPSWRPALALAGVLLLIVTARLLWDDFETGGEPRYRGEEAAPAWTLRARGGEDGGLLLSWNRVPGADAYRVRLYDAGLAEIAVHAAGADSLLALEPQAPPMEPPPRFWAVTAYRDGDPLAESELEPLPAIP